MRRARDSILCRLRGSRAYMVLAPALLMVCLGVPGIRQGWLHTDSHVYLAVVIGMLDSGDWLHPMLGNVPYHNKPPLGFWVVLPFVAALGPTLLAVRIAMILVAAACAAAVTAMFRGLVPARVALTGGIVFVLTHEVFRYTHAFSLDLTLTLFMVLSVWSVVHAAAPRHERARSGWWVVLGGLPMGLALMVKPMLALLILIPVGVWLVLIGRARLAAWIPGLALVAVAVAAPWHIEMIRAYPAGGDDAFAPNYFFSQSLERLSSGTRHVTEPWWYYLSGLARRYVPWILFLVGGLAWQARSRKPATGRRAADWLALLWAGFWVLTVSLSAGKSMRYLVPAYPALALYVGGVLTRLPWRDRVTPVWSPLVLCGVLLAAAALPLKIHSGPPPHRERMYAFLDQYSGGADGWPRLWIAPDQLREGAQVLIERGVYPSVARGDERPVAGDVVLYRRGGVHGPREADVVIGEFGEWVATRVEGPWHGYEGSD